MKKNFVIKLLMLSVAACITISGCGDEPSSPAQSTEVQSSGNTNKVEGLQKSEPQYDPVTTPVAVVEDEVDVAEEEQSMPAPMKEILDARPEDNKVQIYDYIEAENEVWAYGFTINPNINVDDYIKTDNWQLMITVPNLPWESSVSTLMDKLENKTSLRITWEDYNPDFLLLPKYDKYIKGNDDSGNMIYLIGAINDTDSSINLSEATHL